ncbi:MAG: hypothetical protein RRE78_08150 [Acidianus sp.]|jgi:hypothetical protein|nr:hypothetical protein [Acidianus sp.]
MKAVLPLGSSLLVFETAVTSILRASESFNLDEILLLVPRFARNYLRDITSFLGDIGFSTSISVKDIEQDISDKEIDKILGNDSILIPSASSIVYIIKFVSRAVRNGNKVMHILFPFGPWLGLYYPYVPRFIVKNTVIEKKMVENKPYDFDLAKEGISKWLKDRELSKIIALESLKFNNLNKKNYSQEDEINLCLKENGEVTTDLRNSCLLSLVIDSKGRASLNADPIEVLKKFDKGNTKEGIFKSLAGELGFYSINASIEGETHNIRELGKKFRGIIVDTNLIYSGIALYPDISLILPYCAYIEISNNRANMKTKRVSKIEKTVEELAWIELREIISRFSMIPTPTFFCDAIMPMIDPLLLKDTLILTDDEGAYQHWRTVITNATVGKLSLERENNGAYLSYSIFLLSWVIRNLLNEDSK